MMISASLMSIILTAGYLCLNSSLSSQRLIDSRAEVVQNARVAMDLLAADLRGACLLDKEYQFVGMQRTVGEMQADNLDFATHNYTPRHPREGDFCEISYFLDKSRESELFSLWRRRNPTIAPDPLSGGRREEIAQGVRGLRFEYYDGYDWYDSWGDTTGRRRQEESLLTPGNLSGLPEAVRITLWLDPNPRSAGKQTADQSKPELPSVFQTVVQLNLADSPANTASGGSSTNVQATSGSPGASGSGASGPGQKQP